MSDPAIALVMLGILVFTICIGFPVAFTLMALGVGAHLLTVGARTLVRRFL